MLKNKKINKIRTMYYEQGYTTTQNRNFFHMLFYIFSLPLSINIEVGTFYRCNSLKTLVLGFFVGATHVETVCLLASRAGNTK